MSWRYNPFTGQLDKIGQSGGPGPGPSPLASFSGIVGAGQTETLFSDDFSLYSGSKIFFTSRNFSNLKYKTFDFTVGRDGSTLQDALMRVGKFDITVSIQLNAGNIELVVTNNESFDAAIEGYRLNF